MESIGNRLKETSWGQVLNQEFYKKYFLDLSAYVDKEYEEQVVFPPKKQIFNAFYKTPIEQVKVVILGQDPYHGLGEADGLAFSVPEGIKLPPSLKNIFKELDLDLSKPSPKSGNLESWASQGVFLLNTTLTVREDKPLSHYGCGWEIFTDAVILSLAMRKEPLIFVLWGKMAQKKELLLKSGNFNPSHMILKASHPSPFSAYRGFFGCRHFSIINQWLEEKGQIPIHWSS